MRYLRMLTNSIIGGGLVAAYITILVLQLNPGYRLAGLLPLAITLELSYGVHAAATFYVLIVLRQLTTAEILSPGWISFRFLIWVGSAAAVVGTALMWLNLRSFRGVLDDGTFRRMASGALALSLCLLVFLVIGLVHYGFHRRTSRVSAALLGLAMAASLALPLTARGPGIARPPAPRWTGTAAELGTGASTGRVTIILLEGGSLDIIGPAVAEGRLPNLGRILDSGASMHLATLRPTQPGPVWTAAATGKSPMRNGIRSAATSWPVGGADRIELLPDYCYAHALVRFGFLHQQVHDSDELRARPFWSILNSQGISTGIVNWPVTQPAGPVQGYLVTDRFQRLRDTTVDPESTEVVWPREALAPAIAAAGSRPTMSVPLIRTSPSGSGDPGGALVDQPCRADRALEQVASALDHDFPTRVTAIRYECLDAAGHYFLRYAMPWAFGDVSDEERQRYGHVLVAYYSAADVAVGRAMAALKPGDLLLVVSGFGMEPLGIGKRMLERAFGTAALSGSHERAPDGFLLAFGTMVSPGRRPPASILDLTPTLLYYLGLPLGRDMDGHARADLFDRAFTAERPITFIPSYDR